jgi:hypothetical protein
MIVTQHQMFCYYYQDGKQADYSSAGNRYSVLAP